MMNSITINEHGYFTIEVDTTIYDDAVIDKVLYWLTENYIIYRKTITGTSFQEITLEPKRGFAGIALDELKEKLSDRFIDFKNRQQVIAETKNLRDLLFAKAFANSDDFVEFSFPEQ